MSTTYLFTTPFTYDLSSLGKSFEEFLCFRYVPTDIWHSGREKLGPWILSTWNSQKPVVLEFIQSEEKETGTYSGFHTDYTIDELCFFLSLPKLSPLALLQQLPAPQLKALSVCSKDAVEAMIASLVTLQTEIHAKIPQRPATARHLTPQYKLIDSFIEHSYKEATALGKPLLLLIGEHHQSRSGLLYEMGAVLSAKHYNVHHYYFETSDTLMPNGWILSEWNSYIQMMKNAAGTKVLDNSMLLTQHVSKIMTMQPLHYHLSPLEYQVAIEGKQPPATQWRASEMSSTQIHSQQMIDDFLAKHPEGKSAMFTTGAMHVHDFLASPKLADFHIKAINVVEQNAAQFFYSETHAQFLFSHPLDTKTATDTLFHDPRVLQMPYALNTTDIRVISKLAEAAKLYATLEPHDELPPHPALTSHDEL